ncbi:hypothetical protein ABIC78_000155 [Novosphingobium sp. 1529]|uniref:DUF459 domain-containing protein n=1 Tax=Novosphingobium sp. 1529 TaxID=3156424 RepID=UPI003399F625
MGKRRWIMVLDRGAVLFIGIAVGTVLGLSFRTGGKPWQSLPGWDGGAPLVDTAPADGTPAPLAPAGSAPAPSLAPGCSGTFPKSARVAEALAAHRPLHIGVFGDSFGDGLWAATDQAFRKYPDVKVHQFSHEGTGFTRYRTRDLLRDAKDRVAGQPIDVALISIGANDTQGLFVNGHAAAYMTPAWQETIEGRMTALVRMLQQRGVAVGWVGLPRMRDATYDRDIQAMNRFYAKVTCRLGVPFANAVPVSQDRQGHFALRLIDPATGKDYLARANDGKHMTFHGYEVISRPVVQPILTLLAPPAAKPENAAPAVHAANPGTAPAASASHATAPKRPKRPAADAVGADVPSKPTGLPTDLPTHKSTASPTDLSTAPAKAPADAKPASPAPTPSASPSKSSAGTSLASGKRS